jgi:hypothetical protein
LQGNVNGFLFCKNIKFKNQEDGDWADLREKPSRGKWLAFKKKYPVTRFEKGMDELISRMIKGEMALKTLEEKKDIDLAIEIKTVYKDIPYIRDGAEMFINDLAANPISNDKNIESAAFNDTSLFKDFSNASFVDAAPASPGKESELKQTDSGSFSTKSGATART